MMDHSSVQHGVADHVLHHDLSNVDTHLLSLPSVHSHHHHVLSQQVPLGGYMHPSGTQTNFIFLFNYDLLLIALIVVLSLRIILGIHVLFSAQHIHFPCPQST